MIYVPCFAMAIEVPGKIRLQGTFPQSAHHPTINDLVYVEETICLTSGPFHFCHLSWNMNGLFHWTSGCTWKTRWRSTWARFWEGQPVAVNTLTNSHVKNIHLAPPRDHRTNYTTVSYHVNSYKFIWTHVLEIILKFK